MRYGWRTDDWLMFALAAFCALFGLALVITGNWVGGPLLIIEGLLIASFRPQLRAVHNAAWLNGRIALLASMGEAQARGMHPEDWIIAEAERDGFGVEIQAALREREEGSS